MRAAHALPALAAVLLVAVLALSLAPGEARPPTLRIAAASSLRATLPDLIEAYTRSHPGTKPTVSFAASGTLAASIERGAPYDLFLCADETRPRRLDELGRLTEAGVQPLAASRVVLVQAANPAAPDALAQPRLAIPNPDFAPYGKAARAWLDANPGFGPHTLVFADGVAGAAGLFRAGAVRGAFVDPRHAAQFAHSGRAVIVELEDAPPISLTACVMRTSDNARDAQGLIDFLRAHWPSTQP